MASDTGAHGAGEVEQENREWLESLDDVFRSQGPERVGMLLRLLAEVGDVDLDLEIAPLGEARRVQRRAAHVQV